MIPSIYLYMMVAMYMFSGPELSSAYVDVDGKMICDRTRECQYMVGEMEDRRKMMKIKYLQQHRNHLMRPSWPFVIVRAGPWPWAKVKRGPTWTRLKRGQNWTRL